MTHLASALFAVAVIAAVLVAAGGGVPGDLAALIEGLR